MFIVHFIVVDNTYTNLLGLDTLLEMGLISVDEHTFQISKLCDVQHVLDVQRYPKVFDKSELGTLPGHVTLYIKQDSRPQVLPPRKIPFAVQSDVEAELNHLVKLGILQPVTEPTEWVKQMAIARKKNGDLRLCIDPKPLNNALMREHYQLPTLDDTLAIFSTGESSQN